MVSYLRWLQGVRVQTPCTIMNKQFVLSHFFRILLQEKKKIHLMFFFHEFVTLIKVHRIRQDFNCLLGRANITELDDKLLWKEFRFLDHNSGETLDQIDITVPLKRKNYNAGQLLRPGRPPAGRLTLFHAGLPWKENLWWLVYI